MLHYNLYIKRHYGHFMGQSLCHYGILLQNNQYNKVYDDITLIRPYYVIDEGIILHPNLCNQLRITPNAIVYKNGKVVLAKVSDDNDPVEFYNDVYDLYIDTDKLYIDQEYNNVEAFRKIYTTNTEPAPVLSNKTDTVAGLASGHYLAEMAYNSKATHVFYFDYSKPSLDFQKQLIVSDNRYVLFEDNINNMTIGSRDATIIDLKTLNMDNINYYYDYLKSVNVTFLEIDLRKFEDINKLFSALPVYSTLWISNVLHYITSINDYSDNRYNLLDRLSNEKSINILPHTRIYYEGSHNLPQ